jgi:hypothetical protein
MKRQLVNLCIVTILTCSVFVSNLCFSAVYEKSFKYALANQPIKGMETFSIFGRYTNNFTFENADASHNEFENIIVFDMPRQSGQFSVLSVKDDQLKGFQIVLYNETFDVAAIFASIAPASADVHFQNNIASIFGQTNEYLADQCCNQNLSAQIKFVSHPGNSFYLASNF